MRLVTKQARAHEAYKRWMAKCPADKDGIGAKLKKLGSTPDPQSVDKIIGDDSLTELFVCSECGERTEVVEMGEMPDYKSCTAWVCLRCLRDAVALLESGMGVK